MYYQNCVLWPPCWALSLLHPLAPPLPHSPQSPSALPTWQMLIHSKWEERTESKTRAAKYEQLFEMEAMCIILRWHTLFLRTWMIVRGCTHMTSILEEIRCHFSSLMKFFKLKRGSTIGILHQKRSEVAVHWTVPCYNSLSKYHSVLCYIFDHLSKTTCFRKTKHGIPFSGLGPASFCTKPVLPHTHLNLDLNS